jgi:hypothetical protein
VVELAELADLVREPETDALTRRRGSSQTGIDEVAATLMALRRLPDDLTVRVVLPVGAGISPPASDVEAALHRRAREGSFNAWREAMSIRSTGLSQLPRGFAIATVSWVLAYILGYFATQIDGGGAGLLAVSAMLVITIAWVVSWVIVEAAVLDWRPAARQAAALELLSRARLEVINDEQC